MLLLKGVNLFFDCAGKTFDHTGLHQQCVHTISPYAWIYLCFVPVIILEEHTTFFVYTY